MSNIKEFFIASKGRLLFACLVAVGLYAIYQFYPFTNELIGWGMAWTIGRLLPEPMAMIAIAPWIVTGLLWAMISIIYFLVGVRNSALAAALGFSVSFFIVSLLATVIESSSFIEVIGEIILAYILFLASIWVASKVRLSRILLIIVAAAWVGISLYFTPIVTQSIAAQKTEAKNNKVFEKAVESLPFTPYYPTYSSSIYPASPAKLNGYYSDVYTNETVTFLLGKAHVKQSVILWGQDKIMDFAKNCDFGRIWYEMEDSTSIKERDIERSLDNPQKCHLIETTPTGKKVYLQSNGQWTRFYVKLDQTNFIIEFDDINGRKYDASHQAELLKVIDSLQPLDTSKLENGKEYGHGFSA